VRLTYIRLLVRDYDACFSFYRDVMGFGLAFGDESGPYCDFDAGADVELALFVAENQLAAAPSAGGDQGVLVFGVDDVDSMLEELRGRGASVAAEPVDRPDWGIRVAYVRDPDGNLIELNHPIPAGR
jgi:catechol 2,3-dioxygenase-like lactoylglutathione lyase family enzyme